jgi:hypothetical protein
MKTHKIIAFIQMEQALETFTAAFYFHSNHKDIEVQVSLNEAIDLVCENVFSEESILALICMPKI